MPVHKKAVRFGANDHPICAECKNLMRLTRRVPHPIHGIDFEQQTFECRSCRYEIERSADRLGEIPEKSPPTLWLPDESYVGLAGALKQIEEEDQWIDNFIKHLNYIIEDVHPRKPK
jgi:hypothetical protein